MMIKMPPRILALALALAASNSYAAYPDLAGAGSCDFVNPFAGTSDCVQYTGVNWTDATADADCQAIFSTPGFTGTYTPGGTCAIADHGADCVQDLGGTDEKVNQNVSLDEATCGTLTSVCASILVGEYFPVTGSVCDAGGGGGDVDYGTLEQEAIDAVQPNTDVDVSPVCDFDGCLTDQINNGAWTSYTPLTAALNSTGVIFLPGGGVDFRAYGPLAQELAKNGVYTAIIPGPDNTIINAIISDPANASISQWVLAGHSLGGTIAVKYIQNNPGNIAGLALLASYPDTVDDISGQAIKTVSIYGTNDLIATPMEVFSGLLRLPAETLFAKIRGGNHAQFGFYGPQSGDGSPDILNRKQLELTAASVRHLVARVNSGVADSIITAQELAYLNTMTNIVGTWWTQRFGGGGYSYSEVLWNDLDVLRTATSAEFVSAQPSLTTTSPRFHLAQYVAQTGNPNDVNMLPIIDGELQVKFLTQARIENELGIVINTPQGSCGDVNDETVKFASYWLTPAELANVNTWTLFFQPDLAFTTGPDFIADPTSVVKTVSIPSVKYMIITSPTFIATLDPINGPAAGRHYCKTLGYERAYLMLREMSANTP